jgi:hypothetical protein
MRALNLGKARCLSVVRSSFDSSRLPSPCFIAILDLTRSAPCVRIFGSVAWYPVFLRHEIHRHCAYHAFLLGFPTGRLALLSPSMLYLYGETPIANYGPRSILLYLYYHLLQAMCTFCKYYFTLLQTNISFHTICLILCF